MLARAGARTLWLRPLQRPAASSILQLRAYAKDNKPRRPNIPKAGSLEPLTPKHGPDTSPKTYIPPTEKVSAANATSKSSDNSGNPDFSELQDEFQTSKASEKNIPSQATSFPATESVKAGGEQEEIKFSLHDLTKGLPSTIDAELAEASSSNQSDSTNVVRASSGGRGDRQMPASAYITSAERRRNWWINAMFASMLLFAVTGPVYLGRNWDTEEEERKHADAPSGWGFGLFYNRVKARLVDMLDYYNEPAFPKLLPNPDPVWERPYTLVLSLEDLLVHSEWSREHGWRMAKRPGVDYFIRYLSQYYELVIFTSVSSMIADPIIRKLDPYRMIMWPLFREATRYKNGEYIKDLSYLNRPLNRVILLDTVAAHASLQPENAIVLPKWKGDPTDKELVSLIPFLEYVATMNVGDTRKVLKSFEGSHIPTEFASREAAARTRFQQTLAEERAKRPRRSGVGLLGSALGIKPGAGAGVMVAPDGTVETSLSEGFEQGKMLQDQIRERGQKQYELIEKEIRENGEKWLKEMAAEEEKMKDEQMKSMKQGAFGWLGFAGREGEKKVEKK